MYDFWHDYIKEKYGNKVILCYTDRGSFIMCNKTVDFQKDFVKDVKQ